MSESHNYLRSLFARLDEVAKKVKLLVNEEKSEYVVMVRKDNITDFSKLRVGWYEFRRGKKCKVPRLDIKKKKTRLTKEKGKRLFRIFQKENILSTIKNRRFRCALHASRSQNQLQQMVMDGNPVGKTLLERPQLSWGNI